MEPDPTSTDAQLLRTARRDPRAFDAIYVRHAGELHSWLVRQVGDDAVALDLTAETFAQAWRHRRRFRAPADGSAGAWLHGIARNLFRTWSHHQRVESGARQRLGMQVEGVGGSVDSDEALDQLDAARVGPIALERLRDLPADQRAAVTLRVLDELSYDEIAARLECSAATARMRVHRGLRSLNATLEGIAHD
ncbi:MAG: polymerase, sigma-24 subunit, subfamily [Thermoleophilia bacterium]|nr:polymerase, sigma-24 subunit, subfamily [Thermoleophilia bacterium]